MRIRTYRKLALNAVADLGCFQRWTDAIKYPSRPIEATHHLPGEHVWDFWKRCLQARLTDDTERRHKFINSRSTRAVERWSGPAVVIGHAYDGEAR